MNNDTLRINLINETIQSQESSQDEINKKISTLNQELLENRARLSFLDDEIQRHKSDLKALGGVQKISSISDSAPQFSTEYTYRLLSENNEISGLQVKQLVDLYEKQGWATSGRPVFRHIEDLMKQNRVYQINPDARRSRRYRVTETLFD